MEDQVCEPKRLQDERKIIMIGPSRATVGRIERIRAIVEIATGRAPGRADILEHYTRHGIGFRPLSTGRRR
ncbi:hypothetical protein [Streptomyces sp. NRRL F-5126]|uniref:hypothetical protein n=1 Tax=Streptomyces sp. NRRL F-5126 TaxID=1463857 RepID=UPI0004C7F9DA|nr:hypothetical protein [Streptomyces sp. NRRL F-5126]